LQTAVGCLTVVGPAGCEFGGATVGFVTAGGFVERVVVGAVEAAVGAGFVDTVGVLDALVAFDVRGVRDGLEVVTRAPVVAVVFDVPLA
jgi:hypothetical protein